MPSVLYQVIIWFKDATVAGLLMTSLPSLSNTLPPKAFISAEWK
jgi:hypothetical protein